MIQQLEEDFKFVLPQMRAVRESRDHPGHRKALASFATSKRTPQVMVKITSFSSAQNLADHLDYISRNGANEMFDNEHNSFNEIARWSGNSARQEIQLFGKEIMQNSQAKEGKRSKGRPRSRVSMNMLLSMPQGTDKVAFERAVEDFLSNQYGEHDYLYTFHDDRAHYHAHIVVGLRGRDNQWLNPRKMDIAEWRENFAGSLRAQGIAAQATPAYSRGERKSGYRRDLRELEQRGVRRSPSAVSYDRSKEDEAIQRRGAAWKRIADSYRNEGDPFAERVDQFISNKFSPTIDRLSGNILLGKPQGREQPRGEDRTR